ncbi:MAG TPA: hypothetical protein VK175_06210 [Leadbetterella sp.]|nr:hypothetical protein [Leadbetterella sp.]
MKNRILGFLILAFVGLLATMDVTAQRVRTTAVFDGDTATRPKAGFYGVGVKSGRVFLVKPTGNTERILAANTHVGVNGQFLTTNGTTNRWANIAISNVTSLQSSLDGKFNTPSGLTTNYLSKWTGSAFGNSLIFDNGTNVGISTSNPEHKLHINGGLYASGLTAPQTATTSGYSIGVTGGLPYSYMKITSAAADTKIWDHYTDGANLYYRIINDANSIGTTYMRINRTTTTINGIYFPNGNVGIGTTSPQQKTHINTSLGGVPVGLYLTNDATNATLGRGVGVLFGGTGNTNLAQIEAQTLTASNNTGGLIFRTANGGTLTERMRIDQNGNVGIGTASPGALLDINGASRFLALDVRSSNYLLFYNSDNSNFSGFRNSGATGANNDNIDFFVAGGTRMRINNSGRLGIGTLTPDASALLHVSSTTQGVLITRGTTTQINAIASPANGLMVYNTTLNKLCVYENGAWKQVTTTAM